VLSERTPAPVKVASAAPVPAVLAPVAAIPAPVAAAPAVAAAAPVLAIPAAPAAVAGGVSPLLGGLALVPLVPAVFNGGNGGGGVTTLEIAPAVPEPATWLMMISGFGILGFAMRRRRRQQRNAAVRATGALAVAPRA
jgi:hypothetical protein